MDDRVVTHAGRETTFRLANPEGDGEAIVWVHGAGLDARLWQRQLAIAGDRPLAAIDLSGHGGSEDVDATAGGETLTAYVTDLQAVLEAVDGRFVVGHELGGAVTLECLAMGQDLDGAVCIGMGRRIPIQAEMRELAASDLPRLIELLHRPDRLFADPDPDSASLTRSMLADSGQALVARDYETCHRLDLGSRLADIAVPVRIVVGARDRLTPPESNRKLADRLPQGSLALLADAGHLPMLERPEALWDVVDEAIADLREAA